MAGHVEKGVGKQSLPQRRKTEPRSSNPNPVSFLYPSLPECLDLINISLDEMDCFLSANIFFLHRYRNHCVQANTLLTNTSLQKETGFLFLENMTDPQGLRHSVQI